MPTESSLQKIIARVSKTFRIDPRKVSVSYARRGSGYAWCVAVQGGPDMRAFGATLDLAECGLEGRLAELPQNRKATKKAVRKDRPLLDDYYAVSLNKWPLKEQAKKIGELKMGKFIVKYVPSHDRWDVISPFFDTPVVVKSLFAYGPAMNAARRCERRRQQTERQTAVAAASSACL